MAGLVSAARRGRTAVQGSGVDAGGEDQDAGPSRSGELRVEEREQGGLGGNGNDRECREGVLGGEMNGYGYWTRL